MRQCELLRILPIGVAVSIILTGCETETPASPDASEAPPLSAASAPAAIIGVSKVDIRRRPLILLDGVVVTGPEQDVPPTDVESVQFLASEEAVRKYGASAAAGAIELTTKKGGDE